MGRVRNGWVVVWPVFAEVRVAEAGGAKAGEMLLASAAGGGAVGLTGSFSLCESLFLGTMLVRVALSLAERKLR